MLRIELPTKTGKTSLILTALLQLSDSWSSSLRYITTCNSKRNVHFSRRTSNWTLIFVSNIGSPLLPYKQFPLITARTTRRHWMDSRATVHATKRHGKIHLTISLDSDSVFNSINDRSPLVVKVTTFNEFNYTTDPGIIFERPRKRHRGEDEEWDLRSARRRGTDIEHDYQTTGKSWSHRSTGETSNGTTNSSRPGAEPGEITDDINTPSNSHQHDHSPPPLWPRLVIDER